MAFFRSVVSLTAALMILAACNSNSIVVPAAGGLANAAAGTSSSSKIYATTLQYVEHFYPLWFTYGQSAGRYNAWKGPDAVGPLYHIVVLINVDTLYASTFADLSRGPVIAKIPNPAKYGANFHFSLLALDAYGDIFDTGITTGGTYGFVSPSYGGTLPCNITPVTVPASVGLYPTLIVRADKYDKNDAGVYSATNAEGFRKNLHIAPLSVYSSRPGMCNSKAGPAQVLSQTVFSIPFKTNADYLAQNDPIGFLGQMQAAVNSTRTPPLTPADQRLANNFNSLFKELSFVDPYSFMKAVRDAHQAIVNYIPQHASKATNYWSWFGNIGGPNWNDLLRSAITEDCQYCNNQEAAAYYFVFADGKGKTLDGSKHSYVLTFSKNQIPQTKRFWSLTAYTPDALELIPNAMNKYGVASYTQGLQYNKNHSVSIYMSVRRPKGVPVANWLPVRSGVFMLALRDYGPEGSVLENKYTPPAIKEYSGP